MQLEQLDVILEQFVNTAPVEVVEQLQDVDVIALLDVSDARAEIKRDEYRELFEALDKEGDGAPGDFPDDVKGCFLGFPLTRAEDATGAQPGDDGPAEYDAPDGVILMVAGNLQSEEEARTVLMHEVGHALGIDEDGVDGIGLNDTPGGQPEKATENSGNEKGVENGEDTSIPSR